MIPASFDEANVVLNPPVGVSSDDCDPLNIWRGVAADGKTVVISCWKLTQEEIDHLVKGGRLWLWVHGVTMPPVSLDTEHPFQPKGK